MYGLTYEIKKGWQQLGTSVDITDLSIFNDKCVDLMWIYDINNTTPEWKLHIANGNEYNWCGSMLENIKGGQGFWVKGNSECNITIEQETCTGDECSPSEGLPVIPDIESDCYECENNNSNGESSYNWSICIMPKHT